MEKRVRRKLVELWGGGESDLSLLRGCCQHCYEKETRRGGRFVSRRSRKARRKSKRKKDNTSGTWVADPVRKD
jgi:hypothetical protein